MFYLPKNIYNNLQTLAKENKISISKQIIICLEYAMKNFPENSKQLYTKYTYTKEQLPYLDTVHFVDRYTSSKIKNFIYDNKLTPIQIVNLLNYGQHYKEIEERRELCHKYKLNYQTTSTKK